MENDDSTLRILYGELSMRALTLEFVKHEEDCIQVIYYNKSWLIRWDPENDKYSVTVDTSPGIQDIITVKLISTSITRNNNRYVRLFSPLMEDIGPAGYSPSDRERNFKLIDTRVKILCNVLTTRKALSRCDDHCEEQRVTVTDSDRVVDGVFRPHSKYPSPVTTGLVETLDELTRSRREVLHSVQECRGAMSTPSTTPSVTYDFSSLYVHFNAHFNRKSTLGEDWYLFEPALREISKIHEFGNDKYGKFSWINDPSNTFAELTSSLGSLVNHYLLMHTNQPIDYESREPHLTHVLTRCHMYLHKFYQECNPSAYVKQDPVDSRDTTLEVLSSVGLSDVWNISDQITTSLLICINKMPQELKEYPELELWNLFKTSMFNVLSGEKMSTDIWNDVYFIDVAMWCLCLLQYNQEQ